MARIVCAWMPVVVLSIGSACEFVNSDFYAKNGENTEKADGHGKFWQW